MRPLTSLMKLRTNENFSPHSPKNTFNLDKNLLYNGDIKVIGNTSSGNRVGKILNKHKINNNASIEELKEYIKENEVKPNYYNFLDKITFNKDSEIVNFFRFKRKEMDKLVDEIDRKNEKNPHSKNLMFSSKSKKIIDNKINENTIKNEKKLSQTKISIKANTLQNFYIDNIHNSKLNPETSHHRNKSIEEYSAKTSPKLSVAVEKNNFDSKITENYSDNKLSRNIRTISGAPNIYVNTNKHTLVSNETKQTVRVSGPYLSSEKIRAKEYEVNKKKWLLSKGFTVYHKRNNSSGFIKNYVTVSASLPANKHVFREEDKNKWKGKNFVRY